MFSTSFLPSPRLLAPLLALFALTPGCNTDPGKSVAMQDSLELNLLGPARDDLHSPYVQGSKFTINFASTDYPANAPAGWTLRSSNPGVIQVGTQASDAAGYQVTATGTGHTELSVVDGSGNVLDSQGVDVAQPDSVQLCAHGLLLAGYSDAQSRITQASIVEQGTATFLVRYYLAGQEIWGNGAVTPTGSGAVTATTTTSTMGDERDWVLVSAAQPGGGAVSLAIAGAAQPTVIPTTVVAASAIKSVGALMESDNGASDGNTLYVFARAFDGSGGDIYGGSFSWTANGQAVVGAASSSGQPTDAITYAYKGSASESVVASLDGLASPPITVHATGVTLTSTAATNCSVGAPGRGAGGTACWTLGLVAAGALAARVRRRNPLHAHPI